MLRTIYFDNQLCGSAVKIHDKSADDPLFVNLHRIFAKKEIPELALMGSHFPAKPPGIFQLAVIFWYGHGLPSPSSLRSATSPIGRGKCLSVLAALGHLSHRERQVPRSTHYTKRCIEVRSLSVRQIGIYLCITFTSCLKSSISIMSSIFLLGR